MKLTVKEKRKLLDTMLSRAVEKEVIAELTSGKLYNQGEFIQNVLKEFLLNALLLFSIEEIKVYLQQEVLHEK